MVEEHTDNENLLLHSLLNRRRSLARRHRTAPNHSRSASILRSIEDGGISRSPADQLELLAARQERVEMRLLRNISEASSELNRVEPGLAAVEEAPHLMVDFEQARQDTRRGGLPGSVPSEIADDLSSIDGKA